MLYTKFRGNLPNGSGEEDRFKGILPYLPMADMLVK